MDTSKSIVSLLRDCFFASLNYTVNITGPNKVGINGVTRAVMCESGFGFESGFRAFWAGFGFRGRK